MRKMSRTLTGVVAAMTGVSMSSAKAILAAARTGMGSSWKSTAAGTIFDIRAALHNFVANQAAESGHILR
jgi:hypothetical protein